MVFRNGKTLAGPYKKNRWELATCLQGVRCCKKRMTTCNVGYMLTYDAQLYCKAIVATNKHERYKLERYKLEKLKPKSV